MKQLLVTIFMVLFVVTLIHLCQKVGDHMHENPTPIEPETKDQVENSLLE